MPIQLCSNRLWNAARRVMRCSAVLLASVPFAFAANAQTVNWTNAAGGAYSVGTNWSNGTGVGSGSSSLFGIAGSYTVTFLSSASAVNSNITAGTVNFLGGPSRSYLLSGGLAQSNATLNVSSLNLALTGGLTLNSGTLNPVISSAVSSSTLLLGNNAAGTLLLNGGTTTSYRATSAAGTSQIGVGSGTGMFLLSNSTTATFDSQLNIGSTASASNRGVVSVSHNSTLTLNNHVSIAAGTAAGQGTLSIVGTAQRNGAGTLAVGGTGAGAGRLLIDFTGTLSGGTGTVQINPNGNFASLGFFAPAGNVDVNGGVFGQGQLFFNPSLVNIGGTLSLANSGTITLAGGTMTVNSLQIASGFFDWTDASYSDRTLIIDGGSLLPSSPSFSLGATSSSDSLATMKFTNGATYAGSLLYENGGHAELNVLSGSIVDCTSLTVVNRGVQKTLRVLVSGTGSVLNIDTLNLNARNSDVEISVQGGGQINLTSSVSLFERESSINIKPGGTLHLADALLFRHDGTLNIAGGTLSLLNIAAVDPTTQGDVNFTAGTLRVRSSTNVDADFINFALGAPSVLSYGKALQIDGTGTFSMPVQLNGGTLTLSALSGGTNLTLTSGTLNLNNSNTFTIGTTGPLGASVLLPLGLTLNILGNTSSNTTASLTVNGGVFNGGGSYTNNGEIQLLNAGRLSVATLTNNGSGLLSGSGRIVARTTNNGMIRTGPADFLRFTGLSTTNNGTINLLGGVAEFTNGLTNSSGATILGRGSLLVPGTLENSGTLIFTGGAGELQGRLNNSATARVTVTGGATASFYDIVQNTAGSVFKVSDASVAVFLSEVQGLAAFTGAGTIIFESTTIPGPLAASGTAIVESAANVSATSIRDNVLIVRGPTTIVPNGTSAATSRLNSLVIESSGFDLNDNDLVIDYTGASPISTIRSYLQNHLLFSSMADASVSPKFALGYRENSDNLTTFSGQSVDATSLLIAYTFAGDGNLDGKVNTLDFNMLAGAFGLGGQFWINGDYDYNGTVNSIDFNLLVSNFGNSMPLNSPQLGAVVPEPGMGGIMMISVVRLLRRRR